MRLNTVFAGHDSRVEDLYDVDVPVSGGGANFLGKSFDNIRFLKNIRFQNLDRNCGIKL